jgi:hypothetical protein
VDSVIFDGCGAGALADGYAWAQMGTTGVAATLHVRDRLAGQLSSRCHVRGAPVPGSKGPARLEQLLILNRQARVRGDEGRRRAVAGT